MRANLHSFEVMSFWDNLKKIWGYFDEKYNVVYKWVQWVYDFEGKKSCLKFDLIMGTTMNKIGIVAL